MQQSTMRHLALVTFTRGPIGGLLLMSHMQWQWTSKIILLDDNAELNGCGLQSGLALAHVL
jgi:hypothetical protein